MFAEAFSFGAKWLSPFPIKRYKVINASQGERLPPGEA